MLTRFAIVKSNEGHYNLINSENDLGVVDFNLIRFK